MTLGRRMRDTREAFGCSQADLAIAIGLDVESIRRMESGQFDPNTTPPQRLAYALRVRVDWLLAGTGDMVDVRDMTRDMQERVGITSPASGPWIQDERGRWHIWRRCSSCDDRGFTWDYGHYDGFYSICQNCDGAGQVFSAEWGHWTAYRK